MARSRFETPTLADQTPAPAPENSAPGNVLASGNVPAPGYVAPGVAVQVNAQVLNITVPLAAAGGPNDQRYIPESFAGTYTQMRISPDQGRALVRLRDALEAGNVRFADGALVVPDRNAHYPRTMRWLLEQIVLAAAPISGGAPAPKAAASGR
jgi:hypothetical protein